MKRGTFKSKPRKSLKRTPLRKRAKSHTEGWWRNEADDLMQDINRASGGHCEACGGQNQVLHHFITKALSSFLRYKWENGIKLCHSCHFKHHRQSDPTISETIIRKRGQTWYKWIEEHRRLPQQTGIKYYQDKYKELKSLQENNKKIKRG